MLTLEILHSLRELDTPTVSNAIESFDVRPRAMGHTDARVRCMFPEAGTAVGYAVTFTTGEYAPGEKRTHSSRLRLYEAVDAAPKPCILVQQDTGPRPLSACFWGEVMANLFLRLGAEGAVLDGVVRDVEAMQKAGFKVWAAGVTPSRGDIRVVEVNVPVCVGGMNVLPGDIVHADPSGALVVPQEIAAQIPAAARRVQGREAGMIEFFTSKDFSVAELRKRYYS